MSTSKVRNRIVRHVRVRAGELVPNELNARTHPDVQRRALLDLYAEVGFARSLLAYELPDGRLKLIDGHLRQRLDPDMEVDVEVLDVSDAEARKLLLSIDPLATLAGYDRERLDELRALTQTDSDALTNLWASIASANESAEQTLAEARRDPEPPAKVAPQYFVLVECEDESSQVELIERFTAQGLKCRALLS